MIEYKFLIYLLIGLLAHIIATLLEDSKTLGHRVTIKEFMNMHPWQFPLSAIFSLMAFLIINEANQMNVVSALLSGYAGDSIVKKAMNGVK